MKRTNTFKLSPCKEVEERLFEMADNCSRMYNMLNYKRRQSFFEGDFEWDSDEFYHHFKEKVGSAATAQQIIRKNNEAWKSFFALLKQKKEGELPENIERVKPPGYWKDRTTGKRFLKIIIRNDCYELNDYYLKLPFSLVIRWKGSNKWEGKQGRLEIVYDRLSETWYAYQPVEVKPPHQPKGQKKAFVDLGVKNLIMAEVEGENKTFGYSGKSLLASWWDINKKIARHQEELKKVNDKKSSKRLRKLYRKRKRRFRDKVNKIVCRFVKKCWKKRVSKIVVGDIQEIRNGRKLNKKSNSMVHNFWSFGYVIQRMREKAEEYGMEVELVDERGTSSKCPICGSEDVVKRDRLIKCKECSLEMNRDSVGAINIRLAHSESAEVSNRAVARPSLSVLGQGA